jgi:citrate synthase
MIISEIGHTTPTKITLRGADLTTDIIGHKDFVETWIFSALARWPTPEEKIVINAILVMALDHGLMPSAIATRLTLLGAPESMAGAVASGLLGAGARLIGPSAVVARRLQEWTADLEDDSPADAFVVKADAIVREQAGAKAIIPGYGHPIHKEGDPRVPALRKVAQDNGFCRKGWKLADALETRLRAKASALPMNGAGAVGATIHDMGLDPDMALGIALVARCAGLVSHILEEKANPIAGEMWKLIAEQDSRVDYG